MNLRVALIGAGIIARNHLDALKVMKGLESTLTAIAIADIDPVRGSMIAGEYGINHYVDYKEMVLKEYPDIVIIALPHYLHERCAIWCAQQGCHLLLEKPMALTVTECDAILQAVSDAKVKLMVGHTQHYWPANIQAKTLIKSRALGKLIAIHDTRHVHYYDTSRPSWFLDKRMAGGGIMMNLGAHSIDKIQWLTDSRVQSVVSSLTYEGPRGDVEGQGMVFLKMTNQLSAVIVQSGYPGVAHDATELIFTDGMAKLISSRGLWVSNNGQYKQMELLMQEDPFVLQFKDLLQAIKLDGDTDSSGIYARSVIAALEAVYELDRKGAVVYCHP